MTESKEYEDIESKEKSKNRKKSGDSFHNQFS